MLVADEINVDDVGFFAFIDIEDHVHKAGPFRFLVKIGDLHVRIPGFLIVGAQFGDGAAERFVTEGFPTL